MIAIRYIILSLLLIACTPQALIAKTVKTTAAAENNKHSSHSSNAASRISSWEISGAMAARSSRNKGWNASLHWIQQGQGRYQIRLSGPVGSGTVIVSRSGGIVTLRDGRKVTSSPNAEALLKQQTGMYLPVYKLYYWVRGLPAPGTVQAQKRDPAGHLIALRQGGYAIDYGQYTSAGKAALPTNIRLQGNGLFIKLIIKRWRV
jgi:outer membrane lipoprotein LolB